MADQKIYAIVRLRGSPGTSHYFLRTMSLLRLHKTNHAVVYAASPSLEGMLFKVKDRVTWGEISKDDLTFLLSKRGELHGAESKITDEYIKVNTGYPSIQAFVEAVFAGKAKVSDIPNIQPVFRLSPPRKGFKSLKNPWGRQGDLGYRASAISELIQRMA